MLALKYTIVWLNHSVKESRSLDPQKKNELGKILKSPSLGDFKRLKWPGLDD